VNSRQAALDLLQQWSRSRRLADELLDAKLAATPLSSADRAFATELFYGCLRQQLALDFLADRLVTQPPRAVVRDILRLGLYQLHFLRTPAHAAVHETVELAKRHTTPAETRFINAVLRRSGNNNATAVALLLQAPPWVRHSHPQWLWQRWANRYGAEAASQLCEWNNQPPPLYVRGNQPWPGVLAPTDFHPLCYRIEDPAKFFAAPGQYYVQDPSTLIAVDTLDPQPGEAIADLCAAPGGKTTYIAQKMQNRGTIIAADSVNSRLGLVGENCRRLGITIVATLACDAGHCLRGRQFDRVLVDAPCSNTGVMRRRPDLRWRLTPDEINRLAQTQRRLLNAAAALTKPGGILVYSTCSLEPDENEQVATDLPGFTRQTQRATFPPRDNMDGAFVVRYQRQ
jgi:16S rRNA (cytosine967-C5)-methyltransferase